jgi:hypothetical protein
VAASARREIDPPARLRAEGRRKVRDPVRGQHPAAADHAAQRFYPFIGRITPGGGFALGPGYRLLDVAGGAAWATSAAVSYRSYWQIDSRLTWANLAHGRAFASTYGRYYRFPREDFYGIGPGSDEADRSDFDYRQGAVGATVGGRPTRWLTLAGTTEYLRPTLAPGGDDFPNAPDSSARSAAGFSSRTTSCASRASPTCRPRGPC